MWTAILIIILCIVLLTGAMVWRTKWKLSNPGYKEEEAARKIAQERKDRDRRKANIGSNPEKRKGVRKKK